MRYIVDSEEVSRDTFYFCQRAKEKNKSFVLLKIGIDVERYINNHPAYDYYIYDEIRTYYTKGEATNNEWFEKEYDSWSKCTPEDMTKRYQKSKFKDTMTFEEWYAKNGWKYHSETKYESEYHDIPPAGDFAEKEGVKIKLFSVEVANANTVKTINKIRDERGNFSIKYVLRNGAYTEIIYQDTYKEIKE